MNVNSGERWSKKREKEKVSSAHGDYLFERNHESHHH